MATLTGVSISSSYTSLLKLDGNTDSTAAGNGSNAIQVKTGDNEATPLYLNTNRIGIGGQPTVALHVTGDIQLDDSAPFLLFKETGSNKDMQFKLQTDGRMSLLNDNASTEVLTVLQDGSIGIGIENPAVSYGTGLNLSDNNVGIRLSVEGSGGWGFIEYQDEAGTVQFIQGYRDTDETYRINASNSLGNTDGIAITNAGLVGIGSDSPNQFVEIKRASRTTTFDAGNSDTWVDVLVRNPQTQPDSATGIAFQLDSAYHTNGSTGICAVHGTGDYEADMAFITRGNAVPASEKMRIKSDGTVDHKNNYIVNEQGRQNHVANTMSSPYYRFDGTNDKIEVADNANLDFATNDFSVEALVRIPSGVANRTILGKIDHTNAALEGYSMEVGANGKLAGRIVGNNTRTLISEGSTVIADGNYHHVCITFDRSANATVYVNGVAEGTTDISGSSGDASNSNPFHIGTNDQEANFTEMEVSHARVFNNLLTATEVKELYSGASVPYKYKGANQTNKLTGIHDDFDTNSTNHFAFQSNYSQLQATGFTGSGGAISVLNNVMAMTGINNGHGITGSGLLTPGKKFRMTFNVTAITGNWYLEYFNQSESAFSGTGLKTVEWTAVGSDLNIWSAGNGGALTIDASSIVMELVPIGAVAEYDGSSAGEKVWGDKSGNSLDGTVSGATVENAPYDAGTEYEEGLWTPTLTTTGTDFTSVTYDALTGGKYVKVGNLVHVQGFLRTDAVTVGSASNNVRIGGLPYALEDSTSGKADGHASFSMGISRNWAGENPTRMVADANSSTIGLYYQEHNADYGIVVVADVGTGDNDNEIYFSGTYRT